MRRRSLLALLPLAAVADAAPSRPAGPGEPFAVPRRGRALVFPRDHGAHPATRIEWWYATGWLGTAQQPTHGYQLTFFRSRVDLPGAAAAAVPAGRFAPRHLLFAHAAVTDLAAGRHLHAQRIARWSGAADAAGGVAALTDTAVHIGAWSFARGADGAYVARLPAGDFELALTLAPTQPPLLQGDAGFSRKGPDEDQASHYYSQPQLAPGGSLRVAGRVVGAAGGRAWLDHEWSDEILHPQAVGWDWVGFNGFDGSALTAFRLRRADGSALWAGGSFRAGGAAAPTRAFEPGEVVFGAGRRWTSPATQAVYPMQWTLDTPAGRFGVRALLDAQELDSRDGTGTVYWEGLSELLDAGGRRIGLGYLEMTGYAGRLRMG